ncbi:MAG TPA: hypothetical protein VIG32_11375 [Candidatus Baltobacteraceae bacterium]|jgi:hypothetical protein
MPIVYRAAVALTSLILLGTSAWASDKRAFTGHARQARARPAPVWGEDLYSRRALRRARTILELKLLELRKERLDRVRQAIEHHIPIDQLLDDKNLTPTRFDKRMLRQEGGPLVILSLSKDGACRRTELVEDGYSNVR